MALFFARTLLLWHKENPRPLPWSNKNPDPYQIWISEIIMQQTRVEQGTDYYLRFIHTFPTIQSLAAASLDEVMIIWQGLGYYSRARNLHLAARHIVNHLDGCFPNTYETLLSLPGIGSYSAAAIASFAFGRKHVVVDGNVKRVIARFSGILTPINNASTIVLIQEIATNFMNGISPGLFNQAIMNFGALVCMPKKALCDSCPLSKKCFAFQHHLVYTLPVRLKKKANRNRYFYFLVFYYRGKIMLQRREEKDIWHGLFAIPLIERTTGRLPSKSQWQKNASKIIGHSDFELVNTSSSVCQLLSHQTITGRFLNIKLLSPPLGPPEEYVWATKKTMHNYGKPKMIAQYLSEFFGA